MALSNIKMKTATKNTTLFHQGGTIVDSMDFGNLRPFLCREFVPNDKFNIHGTTIAQFLPMPRTTMADMYLKHEAFAVPYRIVWDDWDNFINSKKSAHFSPNGTETIMSLPKCPHFSLRALASIFFNKAYGFHRDDMNGLMTKGNVSDYDFYLNINSGGLAGTLSSWDGQYSANKNYFKFTPRGKRLYATLRALGYVFDFTSLLTVDTSFETQSPPHWFVPDTDVSALPLMALAKCYTDYIRVTKGVDDDRNTGFTHLSDLDVNQALFNYYPELYKLTLDYYTDDYFTSAMQTPSFHESNMVERAPITRQTSDTDEAVWLNNVEGATLDDFTRLTQNALRNLKAVFQWATRNNLAGQKVKNIIKARFGVESENERLKRVLHLGTNTTDISVFRVDVSATTDLAEAGDFAGKAQGHGDFNFTFKAENGDYGMIICMYAVNIVPRYSYGTTPQMFRVNRDDFFTPEFDGMGTRPILLRELTAGVPDIYSDNIIVSGQPAPPISESWRNVFGYTPIYSEYKGSVGIDLNNGDFCLRRWLPTCAPFFVDKIGSLLYSFNNSQELRLINDESFISMERDASFYNKVFQQSDQTCDHIYLFTKVRIDVTRDMCNVFDVPDLEGGREMNMTANGVHD